MMRATLSLSMLSSAVAFSPIARFGTSALRAAATVPLKEGDTIPSVVFKTRVRDDKIGGSNPFTWKDVSTADLFKGKRSVVFALPGGILDFTNGFSFI